MKKNKPQFVVSSDFRVEKTFALSPQDIKSFYWVTNLPTVITWSAFIVACAILSIFEFVGIILLVVAVLYVAFYAYKVIKSYRKSVREDKYLMSEVTMTLTDEGLTTSAGGKSGKLIPWSVMYRIETTKKLYILRVTAKSTTLLPKSALSDQEAAWIDQIALPKVKNGRKARRDAAKKRKSRPG